MTSKEAQPSPQKLFPKLAITSEISAYTCFLLVSTEKLRKEVDKAIFGGCTNMCVVCMSGRTVS